jgi:hypothetical protein
MVGVVQRPAGGTLMMCVPKPNAPHHLGCVMQSPARCQRRLSHPATPEVSAVFASRRLMVSGRPVVVPGGLTLELGIQRRRTTPWPPPPARSDPPCRPRPQVCPATPGAGPSRPQQGTHPGRHTTPTTRHPTVLTQPPAQASSSCLPARSRHAAPSSASTAWEHDADDGDLRCVVIVCLEDLVLPQISGWSVFAQLDGCLRVTRASSVP